MYIAPPQDEIKRFVLQNIEGKFIRKNVILEKVQANICGCSLAQYTKRRQDPGLFKIGELLNCCSFFEISLPDLLDKNKTKFDVEKSRCKCSDELYYFLLFERIEYLCRLKKKTLKKNRDEYGININNYYGYKQTPHRMTLEYLLNISKGLGIALSDLVDIESDYNNYMLLQGEVS